MNKLCLLLWLMGCVNTHPWMVSLVRALFSLGREPEPFPWIHFVSSFLTAINERDIQVFWISTVGVTWDRLHGHKREYRRFTSLENCNSIDVRVQPKLFSVSSLNRLSEAHHQTIDMLLNSVILTWTLLPCPMQYLLISFSFAVVTVYSAF